MANEIQHTHDISGATLYAVVRDVAGLIWNGTEFEAQKNANWTNGDYTIALVETPAAGYYYVGTMPDENLGDYLSMNIHNKVGVNHDVSDQIVGSFSQFAWSRGTRIMLTGVGK